MLMNELYKDQFTPHSFHESQLSSTEMYVINDGFYLWSPAEKDHTYAINCYKVAYLNMMR